MTEATAIGHPGGYAVRKGDLDLDADSVLALWAAGFEPVDGKRAAFRLNWMYRSNPAGPGAVYLLSDPDGHVVGVKCFGHRNFAQEEERLRVGIMADFVVDRRHRSLGPALKLLRAAVEQGKQSFDFVYGFPNKVASAVFRRAGYRELGTMRRYAKPLRSSQFLETKIARPWATLLAPILDLGLMVRDAILRLRGPTYHWQSERSFDESIDELWANRASPSLLTSVRSAELLTWRLARDGSSDWQVITAWTRRRGELMGYVAWRRLDGVAHVGDFCAVDERTVTALLVFLGQRARRDSCRSVSVEFSGSPEVVRAIQAAGLRPREECPVFFMDFTEGGDLLRADQMNWYLTSYDRDG